MAPSGANHVRVRRRDRPPQRLGRAEEHLVGERAAVHRVRHGAAQLHAREPRPAVVRLRAGLQVEPERVGVERQARVRQAQLARRRLALERRVVVGPHLALREVRLPRLQAQQLGVLVGRDLEREPIEIRQLRARRVLAPVLRVAHEDEALAGLVRLQHERAEAGDVGGRRGGAPLLAERAGLEAPRRACASGGSAASRAGAGPGRRPTGT